MTEREINYWLMDMDGVLIREEQPLDGAPEFIAKLRELEIPFLVLTNSSIYTRRDLAARLARQGLDVRRGLDLDLGHGHRHLSRESEARRLGFHSSARPV